MTRAERDQAIALAFKAGETRAAIALRFGLTPRRVGQIAAGLGVVRTSRPTKPRVPLTGSSLSHYVKVRKIMGAAYAREAMGIAA